MLRLSPVFVLAALMVCSAAPTQAMEVWTPETGEVLLEALPRQSEQARLRHALALLGAGQVAGGRAELRELIKANPQAEWVHDAVFAMGRAMFAAGEYELAFRELQALPPESGTRVRALQFAIAEEASQHDLDAGLRMYDGLIETAPEEEGAYALKERADALFEAGHYLDAEDGYMSIIRFHDDKALIPACWYMVAQCQWEMARWLGLGLERLKAAETLFTDYLETFPDDEHVSTARETRDEVRAQQAGLYRQICRFYSERDQRPWAALNYLELLATEYADTAEGRWAAEELKRRERGRAAPAVGEFRRMDLKGVDRGGPSAGEMAR